MALPIGQEPTEMDLKIMAMEKKGKIVPTRNLIKTPEQIEGIRRSGIVNTGCLDAVAEAIHVGMNTQEIDDICMEYCKKHNAIPACLNYEAIPRAFAQVSTRWFATEYPRRKMFCRKATLSM